MEIAGKPSVKQKKPEIKSWYKDKHFALTVQRNILLITSILLFTSVIVALMAIKAIVEKKSVEPYVVKVSKLEQIPVAVNIESVRNFVNAQAGVLEYFLLGYISARESYNSETYIHDYNTVVKRMSNTDVYNSFWSNVSDQATGVITRLNKIAKADIVVKQIALESKNNIAVVRIARRIIQNGNVKSVQHYKIKMHYLFDVSNLTYRDVTVNPLGIKIDFYEVVEEKAVENDVNFNQVS